MQLQRRLGVGKVVTVAYTHTAAETVAAEHNTVVVAVVQGTVAAAAETHTESAAAAAYYRDFLAETAVVVAYTDVAAGADTPAVVAVAVAVAGDTPADTPVAVVVAEADTADTPAADTALLRKSRHRLLVAPADTVVDSSTERHDLSHSHGIECELGCDDHTQEPILYNRLLPRFSCSAACSAEKKHTHKKQ
jgi:hypothetical protein